eukprot:scaffold24401_cov115-Isochrysis_galbana.AAC.8
MADERLVPFSPTSRLLQRSRAMRTMNMRARASWPVPTAEDAPRDAAPALACFGAGIDSGEEARQLGGGRQDAAGQCAERDRCGHTAQRG